MRTGLTVDFQYSAMTVVDIEDDAGARKIGDAQLRALGRTKAVSAQG
jgi:hypothetical protein